MSESRTLLAAFLACAHRVNRIATLGAGSCPMSPGRALGGSALTTAVWANN